MNPEKREKRKEVLDYHRKEVLDYHAFHGDEDVRVIRIIYCSHHFPAALVRIGKDVSCIDDLTDYVVEVDSCKRADEAAMVQRYKNGIEFDEEDGIEWEKRNDE